jgi:serine protease Do
MSKRFLTLFVVFMLAHYCIIVTSPVARADDQVAIDESVKNSIVYVSIADTGYVQIPGNQTDDGTPMWSDPTEVDYTCTGFVVDPSGFIATAGHCVNIDTEVKEDIRSQMISDLVDNGKLDKSKADDLTDTANSEEWPIEGKDAGSPIIRSVQVIQPEVPNRVITQFTTVQVVDAQNFDAGDNAVLKLSGMSPLKPLVIANKAPDPGTALTSVGFPGNIGDTTDQSRLQQPSFKSGTASSQQVSQTGVAGTEVNSDIGSGMSGGPTVDNSNGEVLGINSYTLAGDKQSENFNFITNAPALRVFLQKNGVTLAEPAPPAKSFPWIWVIAGVVAVLAILIAGFVVLLMRRKKSSIPAAVGAYSTAGPVVYTNTYPNQPFAAQPVEQHLTTLPAPPAIMPPDTPPPVSSGDTPPANPTPP